MSVDRFIRTVLVVRDRDRTPRVDLVTPIAADWWPRLWTWLQQAPAFNGDDTTPTTCEGFVALMQRRARVERIWGASVDDTPCGVIAYVPATPTAGMFHGICFDAAMHGTGVARAAVQQVLAALAADGVESVLAAYWPENVRVHRFLRRFGSIDVPDLQVASVRAGRRAPFHVVRLAPRKVA